VIFLARHGETTWNKDRRFQGQEDVPLNDLGREQARALAEVAAQHEFAALYASPLSRALETAQIVGERIGLEPVTDGRLRESDVGDWQGLYKADVERDQPEAWAAFGRAGEDFRFPGGESLEEHAARVEEALADVAKGPLPALVVSHGGTMRRALATRRPHELHPEQPLDNGVLVRVGDDG
jgi:broad specificity phosphatase PhoE